MQMPLVLALLALLFTPCSASAATRQSFLYKYRGKDNFNVHYETALCQLPQAPSLVLVTGFGVGTFHYEKQFEELSKKFNIYSLDLLGQGKSWPTDTTLTGGVSYSIDTWYDQILEFVEQKVLPSSTSSSIHIGGNSLGGYLASLVACHKKEYIRSLILLNNTPFWAFNSFQGGRVPIIDWDGVLPAPKPVLDFASAYFDTLRNPNTVRAMLDFVYSNRQRGYDKGLVSSIIESAGNRHGPEAFSSILFSKKYESTYFEILTCIKQNKVPVLMLYGADDPWITPWWGVRTKAILGDDCIYVECSNSGHCLHHESPTATNSIIDTFICEIESDKEVGLVDLGAALGRYEEEYHSVDAVIKKNHDGNVFDRISDYIVEKFI